MNPMMMLCYMYMFCKHEPLVMAVSSDPKGDEPGWIGLFGGKMLTTEESNKFLLEHLSK